MSSTKVVDSATELIKKAIKLERKGSQFSTEAAAKSISAAELYEDAARLLRRHTDEIDRSKNNFFSAARCFEAGEDYLRATLLYLESGDLKETKRLALISYKDPIFCLKSVGGPQQLNELGNALLNFARTKKGSKGEKKSLKKLKEQFKTYQPSEITALPLEISDPITVFVE